MKFFVLCLLYPCLLTAGLIDLEDMTQDFVLETKKIDIPEYPTAFNPSIMRWNDSFLLIFRIHDPETNDTSQSAYVWLDQDFNLCSPARPLEILFSVPQQYSKIQDPRILSVNNEHFIVFNNQVGMSATKEIRRMFAAKLRFDSDRLYTLEPEFLKHFHVPVESVQEKNWAPFEHHGELILSHTINPHITLKPVLGTECCLTMGLTEAEIDWDWGALRGGTPALLVDEEYLAFFHSSKLMATTHSNGKGITHYFMGAYTFKNTPPFQLTAISPEPIVGKNFYNGPAYNTWKPLRVVFPCGFVFDENYIWVSYGRQDHEIWIVKLDKKGLLESLNPVISKP